MKLRLALSRFRQYCWECSGCVCRWKIGSGEPDVATRYLIASLLKHCCRDSGDMSSEHVRRRGDHPCPRVGSDFLPVLSAGDPHRLGATESQRPQSESGGYWRRSRCSNRGDNFSSFPVKKVGPIAVASWDFPHAQLGRRGTKPTVRAVSAIATKASGRRRKRSQRSARK